MDGRSGYKRLWAGGPAQPSLMNANNQENVQPTGFVTPPSTPRAPPAVPRGVVREPSVLRPQNGPYQTPYGSLASRMPSP